MYYKGRVAIGNDMAGQIAEQTGAFTVQPNGRIKILSDDSHTQLAKLIESSCCTSKAEGNHDGGQVVVNTRIPGRKLLLEIMPIRDDGLPDGDNIQGCAVFILDPENSHYYSMDGLASIFQLSRAEAEIAGALVNGAKMKDISEQRNTTIETVRSQLKGIFSKTGASSQLDLMRLAVKMNPPIKK